MDWLQFFAAVIGHLAWPVVILILLVMVRKQIHSLAERLLELSFGGATVKFDKLLSKGAELVEESPVQLPVPAEDVQTELALPEPHRDIKPHNVSDGLLSIFHAYRVTELLIEECAEKLGVKTREPNTVLRMLLKRDLIVPELIELYSTLRQARNAAAHGALFVLSETETSEFVRQALHLNLALKQASKKLGPSKEQG